MQVVCPNCGARYAVDPLAIGPVGRIVQCARCSHRWLQTVAAAKADAARDAVEAAMNSPETAPTGVLSAQPPASAPEPQIGNSGFNLGPARAVDRADPADPVEAIPDLVIRPPRQRSSLPAVIEARPRTRLPVKIAIAVIVLAVVTGVGSVGYLFRDDIVQVLPSGWRTMLHLAP
jgi:predicted Zn finger-like uncharacterized protein